MKNTILALSLLVHVIDFCSEGCLQTNRGMLPEFTDPERGAERIESNPIQVIAKSYQFRCCGEVTRWAAYVEPGGGMHDGVYSITFQIWRPIGNNSYLKIGENSFPRVNLEPDSVINVSPTNQQLQFQQGDVLGYYLTQSGDTNGGIQFDESFTQEDLWYTTGNPNLALQDRLDIGTEGDLSTLTTFGPIISVSVATSTCITVHPSPTPFPQTLPSIPATVANSDGATNTARADGDSNGSLIAGFTVALIILAVAFTAALVAIIVLLLKRRAKKNTSGKTGVMLTSITPNVTNSKVPQDTSTLQMNLAYGDVADVGTNQGYDYVDHETGHCNPAYQSILPPQGIASEETLTTNVPMRKNESYVGSKERL